MLDVWANGQAMRAHVLGTGTSPVAPQSRSLRCTSADGRDKRVFTVFVPGGAVADEIWVVRLPSQFEPTVAAAWFERGDSKQEAASTEPITTSAS